MDLQVKSYIMIYHKEENFMKAVNYSEGKVNLINAPKPTGEGVLIKINTCGICGTDTVSYTHLTLPTIVGV